MRAVPVNEMTPDEAVIFFRECEALRDRPKEERGRARTKARQDEIDWYAGAIEKLQTCGVRDLLFTATELLDMRVSWYERMWFWRGRLRARALKEARRQLALASVEPKT